MDAGFALDVFGELARSRPNRGHRRDNQSIGEKLLAVGKRYPSTANVASSSGPQHLLGTSPSPLPSAKLCGAPSNDRW